MEMSLASQKVYSDDGHLLQLHSPQSLRHIFKPGACQPHVHAWVCARDVTIHNLDVSIDCHLCIMIQRYIARYNQV